jgi:hypothetical protein
MGLAPAVFKTRNGLNPFRSEAADGGIAENAPRPGAGSFYKNGGREPCTDVKRKERGRGGLDKRKNVLIILAKFCA